MAERVDTHLAQVYYSSFANIWHLVSSANYCIWRSELIAASLLPRLASSTALITSSSTFGNNSLTAFTSYTIKSRFNNGDLSYSGGCGASRSLAKGWESCIRNSRLDILNPALLTWITAHKPWEYKNITFNYLETIQTNRQFEVKFA